MLTCKETSQLISARYDRPLSFGELFGMRLHLLMCRYCSAVARQFALIQKFAGMQGDDDVSAAVPVNLSSEARARINDRLADVSQPKTDGGH